MHGSVARDATLRLTPCGPAAIHACQGERAVPAFPSSPPPPRRAFRPADVHPHCRPLSCCPRRLQCLRARRADLVLPPGRAPRADLRPGGHRRAERLPDRRRRSARRRRCRARGRPYGRHGVRRLARAPAERDGLADAADRIRSTSCANSTCWSRCAAPVPTRASRRRASPTSICCCTICKGRATGRPLHRLRAPRSAAGGRDVLVVEDSAIARKFLALRLQRLGYRVHLADHGEEAIEMVARQSFAVAFVDVVLGSPGSMDGLRVCSTSSTVRRRRASRRRRSCWSPVWPARPIASAVRSPAAMPISSSRSSKPVSSRRFGRSIRCSGSSRRRADGSPAAPLRQCAASGSNAESNARAQDQRAADPHRPGERARTEGERRARGEHHLGQHHDCGHVGRQARRPELQRQVAGQKQQRQHEREADPARARRRRCGHAAAPASGPAR